MRWPLSLVGLFLLLRLLLLGVLLLRERVREGALPLARFLVHERILALVCGRTILPLPVAQDHKAAFDGDTGPNTGGMGAYCPAPLATPELLAQAEEIFKDPTGPSPTRLWLKGLPGQGPRQPVPGTLRQETYIRVYIPVRPAAGRK